MEDEEEVIAEDEKREEIEMEQHNGELTALISFVVFYFSCICTMYFYRTRQFEPSK